MRQGGDLPLSHVIKSIKKRLLANSAHTEVFFFSFSFLNLTALCDIDQSLRLL